MAQGGPPAELGLMPKKKAAPAPAPAAKAPPAELGIAPPAPAKAEKPIPAELGIAPPKEAEPAAEEAKPAADAGAKAPAEWNGPGNTMGNGIYSKYIDGGNADHGWPLDGFAPGLYAPNGLPYPNERAKDSGKVFNEFTGLLENPDGTSSFADGAVVDAPNTWVMTSDDVSSQLEEL